MGLKRELLALLEQSRGQVVSGQQMAERLGVSRSAVWKAVRAMQAEGLCVETAAGRGYRLPPDSDWLSREALLALLPPPQPPVRVLAEAASTNTEAKKWALEGAPHGSLVVAERQSGGRGRLGRSFTSPAGGVYMSVVLRPRLSLADSVLVTAAAAVAVCRSVQALCGLELGIKWVNDLFYEGKKCCGILTEAGAGLENAGLEYIVVGIGVNYAVQAFPPGLEAVAVALYPDGRPPVPRAALAADIHARVLQAAQRLPEREFLPEYRRRSVVLGRPVQVNAQPPYTAVAEEIDGDARLVVRKPNGQTAALASGEISIRPLDG